MKKIIILLVTVFSVSLISAQTGMDALKYIQSDINGTARYMSMAGAFGALGGDVSAIKDNPAGLGVYRSFDLNTTYNFQMQNASSDWNGIKVNDNMYRGRFNNLSYVMALPTWKAENGYTEGLISSNFSFSYNRLKQFDRNVYAKTNEMSASLTDYMAYLQNIHPYFINGQDMQYNYDDVGWLTALGYWGFLINETANADGDSIWQSDLFAGEKVDPSYIMTERGYIDEYAFAWSGNFSNRFYLGIGINLKTISYNMSSSYRETYTNSEYTLKNLYSASGVGFDLSLGAIYRVTDAFRISAAIHTPTVFSITEYYDPILYYAVQHSTLGNKSGTTGPNYSFKDSYKLTNPFQFNAGLAYIIGKKGLISAEYVYNAYSNARYTDSYGNSSNFEEVNSDIKNMIKDGHTIKIGGEYRVNSNVSLRAGLATMSGTTTQNAQKSMASNTPRTDAEYFLQNRTNYLTAGIGYQENGWYIDFAYMHKASNQEFMPFNTTDIDPAKLVIRNNNLIATFGLRF